MKHMKMDQVHLMGLPLAGYKHPIQHDQWLGACTLWNSFLEKLNLAFQ